MKVNFPEGDNGGTWRLLVECRAGLADSNGMVRLLYLDSWLITSGGPYISECAVIRTEWIVGKHKATFAE